VEDSCEHGNEPSGFINCWEFFSSCTTGGFSRRTQLHEVSYLLVTYIHRERTSLWLDNNRTTISNIFRIEIPVVEASDENAGIFYP
jgi:hypothetical protein